MLTTLLPLALMAGLGIALYFLVRRLSSAGSGQPAGLPPEQVDLLYQKTVAQLGSDNSEKRIAALHTLARLAWDFPHLHPSACAAVDSFIQGGLANLPADGESTDLPHDLQIAQTIFARMTSKP